MPDTQLSAYYDPYHDYPYGPPEIISLSIPTPTCADMTVDTVPNTYWTSAGATTLGDHPAALSTHIMTVGEVYDQRMVVAHLGAYQYSLMYSFDSSSMRSPPSDASQVAIFNAVREDFTYHG